MRARDMSLGVTESLFTDGHSEEAPPPRDEESRIRCVDGRAHHVVFETPNGPVSLGRCTKAGEDGRQCDYQQTLPNSLSLGATATWALPPEPGGWEEEHGEEPNEEPQAAPARRAAEVSRLQRRVAQLEARLKDEGNPLVAQLNRKNSDLRAQIADLKRLNRALREQLNGEGRPRAGLSSG